MDGMYENHEGCKGGRGGTIEAPYILESRTRVRCKRCDLNLTTPEDSPHRAPTRYGIHRPRRGRQFANLEGSRD